MDPERWNEPSFAEWLEGLSLEHESIDRERARQLRSAVRIAVKLQSFWSDADSEQRDAEPSWRARVDIAVGVPAWRPGLELAMVDLESTPSEERFDDVRRRFRVVNGSDWLEGESFEHWVATQGGSEDAR